ncbi:Protein N-lysine methyltransferase METTL21A [Lamellibrachia satsuma]|nr:Protein N-lysine methyltransferase METTL21A [Lamellibrachia satsuma]
MNCEVGRTCEEVPAASSCTSLAVVPYDDEQVSELHRPKRRFQFSEHVVSLEQNWREVGVAAVVWDAAVVLCEYLDKNRHLVAKKRVLELGAGTGLVGIFSGMLGGDVAITDRAMALKILKSNVNKNLATTERELSVSVEELDWGKNMDTFSQRKFDILLGADIIYIEETFPLLLTTLQQLTKCDTKLLLSCKIRYDRDTRFLDMMKKSFLVEEVLYDAARDIHIYSAKKIC